MVDARINPDGVGKALPPADRRLIAEEQHGDPLPQDLDVVVDLPPNSPLGPGAS